jgi:hypothetical protein
MIVAPTLLGLSSQPIDKRKILTTSNDLQAFQLKNQTTECIISDPKKSRLDEKMVLIQIHH